MAQLQLLLVCTACTVLLLDAFSQSRRCYCTLSTARHARTSAAILWSSKGSEDELKQSLKEKIEVSDLTKANNEMSAMEKVLVDEQFLQQLTSKRSYIRIIAERLIQSIDDYQLASSLKEKYERLKFVKNPDERRERIVVLGTGWGSHSFLKTVDATKYDVTVISPRNYFTFTPMLAASAVGTVEFRSIIEPIRNANPFADYLEASATAIDATNKVVKCQSVRCEGTACDITDFDVSYDYLLVAVGATTNTFGIKGVREYCLFLKQIDDASNLRRAIASCFERSNIPNLSEEEIRSTLSFIVVGGGPTGVEFTSELRDWIEMEGRRYYRRLLKYVKLTLVEAGPSILAVFDETLQREALQRLMQRSTSLVSDGVIEREMTTVLLKAGVKEVGEKAIELSSGEKIPYGFCLWAAGNGPVPLVLETVNGIAEQQTLQGKARGRLVTDKWLRVLGAPGMFSIGDCAMIDDAPLPATAQVASQEGSYLGRLFSKGFKFGYTTGAAPPPSRQRQQSVAVAMDGYDDYASVPPYESYRPASEQLGMGRLGVSADSRPDTVFAKPFQFLNLGVLAYIGASQALAQVAVDDKNILGSGPVGFLLWRGIYWSKQVSWRNRIQVGLDWARSRVFGRDIANVT